MLTLLIIALPLLFALITFVAGSKWAKQIALASSILECALIGAAVYLHHTGETSLLTWDRDWIGPLGISFAFSLDGIGLIMVLLCGVCVPLIVYSTSSSRFRNPHVFYGLVLMMSGSMLGAFAAADALMFYVFYEFALIPIYFIILMWSQKENKLAITFKFFLYTLFGSLFMLAALLYVHQNAQSFRFEAMYVAGQRLTALEQCWVFAGIFLAFAVKIPIFPFHSWQAPTYDAAPTSGTMLLGAIMLKMATYGLIRMIIPMVPQGLAEWGDIAVTLSVISVIYASCMAIAQKRFKLLLAWSSVAHVGVIAAGVLSGTAEGIQGGIFEMFSHALITIGLFFVCDMIEQRFGTDEIKSLGGIRDVNPVFAFLFFVLVMSSVALPFTSGFVGEMLLLTGLYQHGPLYALLAGLTVILGAVYMLRAFQSIMLGPSNTRTASFGVLNRTEKAVLTILVVLTIIFGVYPSLLQSISAESVNNLLLAIH
jgi:NADH-quinone oxidoreductase subunit M